MVVSEIHSRKNSWYGFTGKLLEGLESIYTKFLISNTMEDMDMVSLQEDMFTQIRKLFGLLDILELAYYELTLHDAKSIWVLHEESESKFDGLVEIIRESLRKFKR